MSKTGRTEGLQHSPKIMLAPDNCAVVHCQSPTTADLFLQCCLGEADHGRLLIELLGARFPYHPVSRWRELIDLGLVNVNGQAAAIEQIVAIGDRLSYLAAGFSEPDVPTCFEPVMENAELLLVGKPAGTPVVRTGLIVRNTLVNLLRTHYGQEIHPLHRLDRETSGLLLCARSRAACQHWQKRIPMVISGKYYLAVVRGQMPPGTIQLDQPLAVRPDSPVRCRMWPDAAGKACRTIFHTLAVGADYSLVLAELGSGRRHQIRAHLAHLGHPLVGDKIYSREGYYFLKRVAGELSGDDFMELGASNHTLHAWAMRLLLPDTRETMYYSRLFSGDMCSYLALFPGWEDIAWHKLAQISDNPSIRKMMS